MLISIIIPVYNVEKYLIECMESVRGCPDTEIILIDDGSTDDSGDICDSFKDENIIVIHKENGGLSSARNTGLKIAKGRYIYFMDSDDHITDFAKILDDISMKECELLLFDGMGESYYTHHGLKENRHYTGIDCIEAQLRAYKDYPTTVWLGVYRREYLLKNNFFFEENLLHEDELWTQKVLINAKDICYLNEKLYFYRQRENSITDRTGEKNISDLIYIFGEMYQYTDNRLIKANISKRYLHALVKFQAWKYDLKIAKRKIFSNAVGFDKIRAFVLLMNTKWYCKLSERLT